MNKNLQPIQLLQELSDARKTGDLKIKANSVNWNIYFIDGQIQYAHHDLQSLETIKHYLMRLVPDAAAKITPIQIQDAPNNLQLISIINQLVDRNYLNSSQKTILVKELSQDALEAFLWLTDGESEWIPTNPLQSLKEKTTLGDNRLEIPPLLKSLQIRLQEWQKLRPLIISPHQRPWCVNPSRLLEKVPNGNLSPAILQKLTTMMRGATIRQLALVLKQDDLKMAQLLFPYLKYRAIQLHLPKSPLDKLPLIPPLSAKSQPSSVKFNSLTSTKTITPVPPPQTNSKAIAPSVNPVTLSKTITSARAEQKISNIVCIDDSPTMLNTIKDYLGDQKYQIFTVENPMQSLSYLFESKPDLILMDLSMPGINGNRLCQILKSSSAFKNVPIIIVSGNTKMLDQEKIQAMGATDFLAKPFTKESLLAIVNKYLENQDSVA